MTAPSRQADRRRRRTDRRHRPLTTATAPRHELSAAMAITRDVALLVIEGCVAVCSTDASASGEACAYNLTSWLTQVAPEAGPSPLDPADFATSSVPLPRNLLTGQLAMDAVIEAVTHLPARLSLTYDRAGNRVQEQQAGAPPVDYAANDLNEYTAVAGDVLEYDSNGNLIREGARRFFYDYRNQLVRVRDESASRDLLRLFHDAHGRRVGALDDGVLHLLYDGPNVIEEYRDGALSVQYVHEYGLDQPVQISANGSDHWYHADLVRSTRRLSDTTGAFDASYRYDAFGEPVAEDGTAVLNRNLFHGRRFEPDADLYDHRARHYSPRLGRFLQRDCLYAPNPYLFVGNNPLVNVDPTGRERESVASGIEVILLVPPVEAITPTETPAQAAKTSPPEIQQLGDGDCNPFIQSCEPTSRPLIPGLISSPPGNPKQLFVEGSTTVNPTEDYEIKHLRGRAGAFQRIETSATQGGLAGAGIIAKAGAGLVELWAEGEIVEAGFGMLGRAARPLGRFLVRETPAIVEAEALVARAVRLAPAARPALTRSTDAILMGLRDQATILTRRLGITSAQRFGTVNDQVFKSLVRDAIDKGFLPSTLRVTPGRPGVFGIDVWDAATGVGWDLTTATVRQVASHERYLGVMNGVRTAAKAMPDGTVILDVRPLVYTR